MVNNDSYHRAVVPQFLRVLGRAPRTLALVVFVALAALHTWPLASNPAHLSRIDNGDAMLNMWAVTWVAHELPRNPLHVFDGNIFFPEPRTLAYSEAMIVQGILAVPIVAAGGSALLAFNLVLLAGLALTGWAFCLLLHRWTGSWSAGYAAGSLAAFNAHVLVRLVHLQTQHVEFIALILFALDRLMESRRVRDAVWLGVGFALQGLTSVYLLVFTTWLLLFAGAARAVEAFRRRPAALLGLLTAAGVIAVMILAPYLAVYESLHRATGLERTIGDAQLQAASWVDYASTGSRLHYWLWSHRFFDAAMSPTFPGVTAVALVALGMVWPDVRRDRRVRMCVVAGVGCAIVSMIPRTSIFPVLFRFIPLFRAVRVEAHLGQMVLLMIAVVAGFTVAGIERRWTNRRVWPAAAAALCALLNIEALRSPLFYRPFDGVPEVYRVLAGHPQAVVVELPFYPPAAFFRNAGYMLNSTLHWRPILNGYSGFVPGSYGDNYKAAQDFPELNSLAALHERGVTHVVVHEREFTAVNGRDRFDAIFRSTSLVPVAEEGDVRIFALK